MPRNVADELGDLFIQYGGEILPYMQAQQAAMAEAKNADFDRALKVAQFQFDQERAKRADRESDRAYNYGLRKDARSEMAAARRYDLDLMRENRLGEEQRLKFAPPSAEKIAAKIMAGLSDVESKESERRARYEPKTEVVLGKDGLPTYKEIDGQKIPVTREIPYEDVYTDTDLEEKFMTQMLPLETSGYAPEVRDSVMNYVQQQFLRPRGYGKLESMPEIEMVRQFLPGGNTPEGNMRLAQNAAQLANEGYIDLRTATPQAQVDWAINMAKARASDFDDLVAKAGEVDKNGNPTPEAVKAEATLTDLINLLIQEGLNAYSAGANPAASGK